MNNSPFFSILVPTYNQCQYLSEALDSLINQTDKDWEAIIVNDGSTDNTANILQMYAQQDSRFQVISKENGGTGSALNLALNHAKGEWVCWLSSDDLFEINKLAIHREWIYKNPDHRFFFSNFQQLVGTTGKIINLNPDFGKEMPLIELQVVEMLRRNYVAGNSICINREAWLNTGYFNEELRYAQDYDMWLRLMIKYKALYIPEFTYLQRIYPEQESQKFSDFCLYDSAKSSIQVLNNYDLEDLFPFLNLQDFVSFNKAINIIFDVMFDPNAFIYRIGFHPLLILKFQKFINKFASSNDNIHAIFNKKLNRSSKDFKNTLQGFWSESLKNSKYNFFSGQEESLILSFEKLAENYYWWLKYIESDSQNSILNYIQKFCNYHIPFYPDDNGFEITLQQLINFCMSENSENNNIIYIEFLKMNQRDFPLYSFSEKILILERLDKPLDYISEKIINKYGKYKGLMFAFWIYFLRFLRLFRQGNLYSRFQSYLNYRIHLNKD
ncbi:glycosyltransferase [Pseudanabaena sp. 'Roaring Creek']|uniref:glycosyltransferase family 2 protein n=1 Tax=Pseudanabaena sp. 'Roaring Creek' TaxID=1681830 RepID=UPI0006D7DE14|nr:glycosyltransferase [Pseudanabaena sp. 'Roaring Creek']